MTETTKIENAEQALELISEGMTLGALFNHTEKEHEAVYALGHGLYMQQQYLDASKYFAFLVGHTHTEKRYVNALASSLQMLHRYEEAVTYYCMASVMDIDDPLPTFHTAECFLAMQQHEQAQEALTIVMQQAKDPQWQELRSRCQVLLDALERQASALPTPSQGDGHE